jgi:hypothetical protein
MGGVGLNVYGVKDQWTSFVLHLVVVPNNQLATTIGHVHLDCVDKHKCETLTLQPLLINVIDTIGYFAVIPITFIVDKGSETGILFANQTGLR